MKKEPLTFNQGLVLFFLIIAFGIVTTAYSWGNQKAQADRVIEVINSKPQ